MNLHDLVSELIVDTRGLGGQLLSWPDPNSSLGVFLPELTICATILLLLFLRIFRWGRGIDPFLVAVAGTGAAFYLTAPWWYLGVEQGATPRIEIFTGMLVFDPFTVFMRTVLIGFALLFAILTRLSGLPDSEDRADIYTLVLGSTLGMCLMSSANHLLMVFMAVEMASVPSYALAGLLKGRRTGSEAALKYSIYGAGAAGVMLYGISLLCGLLNTAHLPTMAVKLSEMLAGAASFSSSEMMVLALGGLMVGVGLAFKLSAVPFHFWAPDVFEGACAEVNAFLSIASKAAALALLVRIVLGVGTLPPETRHPGDARVATVDESRDAVASLAESRGGLFAVVEEKAETAKPVEAKNSEAKHEEAKHEEAKHDAPKATEAHGGEHPAPEKSHPESSASPSDGAGAQGGADHPKAVAASGDHLRVVRSFIGQLVAFLSILTCTFGNLAAYGQTNIKRLLAYSTIAHAGYMMMPISALLVMAPLAPATAAGAVSGLAIYIAVYLFMNLGAFAIVAFLRNAMRSEEIADYAGLIRRCPVTVICFSLILFSLIGLPPLAGFVGKFAIFASLAEGYRLSGATHLLVLLVVGGMNTAVSLFYYLRVVKLMTIDPEPEDRMPFEYSEISLQSVFVCLVTAPTALLLLNWETLSRWANAAAKYLIA